MTCIQTPSPNDILCGKDKTYSKHPGNQLYRGLITSRASAYGRETSKQIKMEVTKDIVRVMEEDHGARFLRKRGDTWEPISNQQARDKTSHALRFCAASLDKQERKSKTARRNQQTRLRSHRRTVSDDDGIPDVISSFQQQYQRYELAAPSSYQSRVHNLIQEMDDEPLAPDTVVSTSLRSEDLEAILHEPIEWDCLLISSA